MFPLLNRKCLTCLNSIFAPFWWIRQKFAVVIAGFFWRFPRCLLQCSIQTYWSDHWLPGDSQTPVWLILLPALLKGAKLGIFALLRSVFSQNLLESRYLSAALLFSQPMKLVDVLKTCLGERRRRWMDSVTSSALFP